MNTRVAINGLGRIGRSLLKGIVDELALELVAVNDLAEVENLAYLLRFDTVYGRYSKPVAVEQGDLVVAGRKLRTLSKRDPSALPWKDLAVPRSPRHARYAGVLGVSRDPLVSFDISGDRRASIIDLELTKVINGDLMKIMSWYDNEWGYANQMLRAALAVTGAR
jgi:glyceraldehyde-3-phosphate dehydrogenase/erythrose-4-phosphate dehydrogenase